MHCIMILSNELQNALLNDDSAMQLQLAVGLHRPLEPLLIRHSEVQAPDVDAPLANGPVATAWPFSAR